MGFEVGKKFWIAATAVIVVVTLFVVGRNLLHAVKIKRPGAGRFRATPICRCP